MMFMNVESCHSFYAMFSRFHGDCFVFDLGFLRFETILLCWFSVHKDFTDSCTLCM